MHGHDLDNWTTKRVCLHGDMASVPCKMYLLLGSLACTNSYKVSRGLHPYTLRCWHADIGAPPPVGMSTKQSWRDSVALMASRWLGRKALLPK